MSMVTDARSNLPKTNEPAESGSVLQHLQQRAGRWGREFCTFTERNGKEALEGASNREFLCGRYWV